jgi:uncharacterized membrane protein YhaH (DUF805 family)
MQFGSASPSTGISAELRSAFFIVTFLPLLAVGARRLHDTGRSGWLQLFGLVPVAGAIVLIVFLAQAGPRSTVLEAAP